MAAPTTQYARSGDVHLAYQVIGDGPRDVVLSLDWASHLETLWGVVWPAGAVLGRPRNGHRAHACDPRARRARALPLVTDRVLTTVLFVDVVGSTERVSEVGDRRWRTLLDRFIGTVERVAGSGIEFDEKGVHSLKGVADPWSVYATLA